MQEKEAELSRPQYHSNCVVGYTCHIRGVFSVYSNSSPCIGVKIICCIAQSKRYSPSSDRDMNITTSNYSLYNGTNGQTVNVSSGLTQFVGGEKRGEVNQQIILY